MAVNAKVQRAPAPPVPVNPLITAATRVIVVKKSYTNPARKLVIVRTSARFQRTGTLTRSSNAIRFFTAAQAGSEITFDGVDNVFPGGRLRTGVRLFAEGASPSAALDDVQLTLTLTAGATPVGPPATVTMTTVELTLDIFAQRLAKGSAYDHIKGGLNEAFAGELIERCGMSYLSMDIAKGYKTEVFDLNREDLPARHRKAYDVVLNIGTTEHVLNQYNSFKVIHEATRTGGFMVHQLPVSGYTDHGYYVYAGRMFFELASFNRYEIVDIWYEGAGEDDLYLAAKRYASSIPVVERFSALSALKIPNYMLTVIYRKIHDVPFGGMLETSTSVGDIPISVSAAYASSISDKLKGALRGSQFLRRHAGILRTLRRLTTKGSNS